MVRPERGTRPDRGALKRFAADLRGLRDAAGSPSYRDLSRRCGYSTTTLWGVTGGTDLPSLAATLAYVRACGGDTAEWERRWRELRRPANGGPAGLPPAPGRLPTDVAGFTGRDAELARLDDLLRESSGTPAVLISAVSGTAGVGKTALAVHWAHRVADRFPDGQLYVDLRGYDPDQPLPPAEALGTFLRALGVDSDDMPQPLDERAARYRTLLYGRRILVVLDNAYAAEQVRPLLPGNPSCLALVTSRDMLTGLVARDGARRVDLDLLPPAEATNLLRALAGDRVDTEPAAARDLVDQCAGLPLTLRIAAEMAVSRPATPLAKLVAELADERDRLNLYATGSDRRTAVRAIFDWSYHRLPAPTGRVFRALGLHPGADIALAAVAALVGVDPDVAMQHMDVLVRAHLVDEYTPGRYRMHDLLRAYAAERAADEDGPDRSAARIRLLHHYLATASAAMDVLFPAEHTRRPRVARPAGPTTPPDTAGAARGWLDAERANLVALVALGADHGLPTHAAYLALTVYRYFYTRAYYQDSLAMHRHALRAARDHADPYSEAAAHLGLGAGCHHLGQYDEAIEHYRQSLDGFRDIGDPVLTRALSNLGILYAELGRYDEALDNYRQANARHREQGNKLGEAITRGWMGLELGRQPARHEEAVENLQQSLAAFRQMGFPVREVEMLLDLGQVHLWAGHHDEAFAAARQALSLAESIDDRFHEADAHNVLAEILQATGRDDDALASFRTALNLARRRGQRDLQARALRGMAAIAEAAGRTAQAREHLVEVLALYTALNMPQAADVRARIAAVDERLAGQPGG